MEVLISRSFRSIPYSLRIPYIHDILGNPKIHSTPDIIGITSSIGIPKSHQIPDVFISILDTLGILNILCIYDILCILIIPGVFDNFNIPDILCIPDPCSS